MAKTPQAPETNVIHPGESLLYAFEFSAELESGETLSGTPTVTEIDTNVLTIASPSISGTQVRVRIAASGATENTLYRVKCSVATSQSNTRVLVGRLKVSRDEGDTPS